MRSAPAAARVPTPPAPRRLRARTCVAGRTRRRCSSTISVALARSSTYISSIACAELLVLHHHVQLPVADPARGVQVGGADPGPARVGHRGLRVQHGAVPLEDADAAVQQRAVPGPGDGLHEREVAAAAGDQQPDVDPVPRRRPQRLHVVGRSRVVGVGEPERAAGERGDQGVEPIEAAGARRWWPRRATRRRPARRSRPAAATSSPGSVSPQAAQVSANARATSATAGPRISTPVSRQPARPRSGQPSQALPDAEARHEGHAPSTTTHLRWSRASHPERVVQRAAG